MRFMGTLLGAATLTGATLFGVMSEIVLAATLNPGDILVTGTDIRATAPFENGGVFRIDPVTGAQTTVATTAQGSGNTAPLFTPRGIAVEPSGNILVVDTDYASAGGPGALFRIDPATGLATFVSADHGLFTNPMGIAIESTGHVLVVERDGVAGGLGGVLRIDPSAPFLTVPTIVSQGGSFVDPVGIAIDASGQILVVDEHGAVIRVDPITGAQTVVSSGGFFSQPSGIAIDSMGQILVVDSRFGSGDGGQGSLLRIDPVSGVQTIVRQGGLFFTPVGVSVEASGQILVVDTFSRRGTVRTNLIRVDPITGTQSIVSSDGNLAEPLGLAIVRGTPVSEPGTLILLASGLIGLSAAAWRRHRVHTPPQMTVDDSR